MKLIKVASDDFDIPSFLECTKEKINFIVSKISKARKKEIYLSKLSDLKENVRLYLEFLEEVEYNDKIDELKADSSFVELEAVYNTILEKQLSFEALGFSILKISEQRIIKEEKEKERLYLKRKEEIEISIKEFREHKRNDVPNSDIIGTDLVRLSKTQKLFVTARRASVPFRAGIRLFKIIQGIKQRAIQERYGNLKVISFEKRNIKLGDFKLDYINKNGDCKVRMSQV